MAFIRKARARDREDVEEIALKLMEPASTFIIKASTSLTRRRPA
jgi:hypothetical protein